MTDQRIRQILGRTGYGLLALVLLLGTINLGAKLKAYADDVDAAQRPFPVGAAVGQPARGRTFAATAVEVRGASVIQASGIDHPTNGVWLIVTVRVVALDESLVVGYAALRDANGRVYVASNRVNQPLIGGRSLQPGLPVIGEIAFELPRDAATSPTLLLAENRLDQRMDSMLELSLGSNSRDTVDGWADDTQPTTLMATELAE